MLKINTVQQANVATITVSGRLDTTTAPQMEAEINKLDGAVTELVMDFEEVEYVSSAGLRVLLSTQKAMSQKGSMILTHVNANVMEVFEITGFSDILTIK